MKNLLNYTRQLLAQSIGLESDARVQILSPLSSNTMTLRPVIRPPVSWQVSRVEITAPDQQACYEDLRSAHNTAPTTLFLGSKWSITVSHIPASLTLGISAKCISVCKMP